jgi:LPS export ABC transporter protein LptC
MVSQTTLRLMHVKLYAVLFFLICIQLFSCKSNLEKVNTKIDKSALDTEKADSVTLLYSNNGQTKAKLQAKTFIHAMENTLPYIEMKDGLKITFFNAEQAVTSVLTARRGRYFENNNNVLLRDSVVVKNVKNEELHTEELIWNEQSKLFYTEKAVRIQTATQIIYGEGMEANQDFTIYKIMNPKGIISINKNKMPMK